MSSNRCIIVLSHKSSGSSALQHLLSLSIDVRHVERTRHFQNETLYWTKAASVLGLPQTKMLNSEVPIAAEKARQDLYDLLSENLSAYSKPLNDRDLIFDGWRFLCEYYAPIFLEKSPHHLLQWSALELIMECMHLLDDIDFLLVGLVRNPMDMLYSAFRRLKTSPKKLQYEWLTAYQNLLRLKEMMRGKVVVVRYEDIVSSPEYMTPIYEFCGSQAGDVNADYLHQKSINKWKNDRLYGFSLAPEVFELARKYGYSEAQLTNGKSGQHPYRMGVLWPLYCRAVSFVGSVKEIGGAKSKLISTPMKRGKL